jgi:hypothetical protein
LWFLRPRRPINVAAPTAQDLVTGHYPEPDETIPHLPLLTVLHTTRSVSPCLHRNTVCRVHYIATHKTCYLHNCKFLAVVTLKSQCRENKMLCVTFVACIPLSCSKKRLPCSTVFCYYYYCCYYYINIINKIEIIDGLQCNSLRAELSGDRIPVGARFPVPVQTGPEDHPTSYTLGTGTLPGVKPPGRGIDHPLLSSAEVKERVELQLEFPLGLRGLF